MFIFKTSLAQTSSIIRKLTISIKKKKTLQAQRTWQQFIINGIGVCLFFHKK